MGGMLHFIWYIEEGPGRTAAPPRPPSSFIFSENLEQEQGAGSGYDTKFTISQIDVTDFAAMSLRC